MTVKEKHHLIENFRRAIDEVESHLKGTDAKAWDFIPPIADAWPIRAQVAHLLDADMYTWARIRKSVAQSGAAVDVWDQEAWAARLDYERADVPRTLDHCRIVRDALADFLESIIGEDWDGFAINHPERGRTDLASMLAFYVEHVAFHLDLIDRNLKAFRSAGSPGAKAR